MIKNKITLLATPFLAVGTLVSLTACSKKYDLVIYNWEDYIYEGADESGKIVDDSTVKAFEKYYQEQTGKKIRVGYECFSTNEEMYTQISLGSISPDLICPSDYMIQKMANEDMLEPFSYDATTGKYGESLSNWEQYGSPYIKNRFAAETLNDGSSFLTYAVPYFWGTMGFTYDPDYFSASDVSSWECLWSADAKFQKQFSLKDSMRDTYVAAIFHIYRTEILALNPADVDYNQKLSAIFNRCDDETIGKVETALKAAMDSTVYGLEVDEGKDDIVKGVYHANLAWSGDSVYSMDSAEASSAAKRLNYSLPTEGSNVWFDGWCMPKGANKELAEAFVNFICTPEVAAQCMDAVGYTSPIVGDAIWELVNDWYAAEEGDDDTYETDLSFYFGDSIEGNAKIKVSNSEKGRQFDAQYPTEEVLKRCCIMKDFGNQTTKVEQMWVRVTA